MPGWTAYACTPSGPYRRSSSTAWRMFAVFDCPYASIFEFGVRSKFGSSQWMSDTACPPELSITIRTGALAVSRGSSRPTSTKCPR